MTPCTDELLLPLIAVHQSCGQLVCADMNVVYIGAVVGSLGGGVKPGQD